MSKRGRNILEILDNAVRWTGFPARVADEMSAAPSSDRKHRPLRWSPIWLIAFSCILFVLSFMWPSMWPSMWPTLLGSIVAGIAPSIHMIGPLGKPSLEDDEREAALRKDSYLVCFGLLTALNCFGQLLVMGLSILQNWQTAQVLSVGLSGLMLNLTLFGCLPTLYASWRMPQLPKD